MKKKDKATGEGRGRKAKKFKLKPLSEPSPFICALGYALNAATLQEKSFGRGVVTYLLYFKGKYRDEEELPSVRKRTEEIKQREDLSNLPYATLANSYKTLELLYEEGLASFANSGVDIVVCWTGMAVEEYYSYSVKNAEIMTHTQLLGTKKIQIIHAVASRFLNDEDFSLDDIKKYLQGQGFGIATIRVTVSIMNKCGLFQ